jgi:hypothetical protein
VVLGFDSTIRVECANCLDPIGLDALRAADRTWRKVARWIESAPFFVS